jgi:Uma2 family endonuclease
VAWRDYTKQSPKLIVEVLSKTTEAFDRGQKFAFYRQMTSLQEYVLINALQPQIEVFRLNAQQHW